MPMIPPPIMSAMKIQINHVILDTVTSTSWTIAALPDKLIQVPLSLKDVTIDKVNGKNGDDGIDKKMQTSLQNSNNAQKIDLVQNSNVSFAKMVDKINTSAYTAGGIHGFQSILHQAPNNSTQYWFTESDRQSFNSINDCKIFENRQVRPFSGNVDDDDQVKKYVDEITVNSASWSTLLIEFSKAIGRLIKKILIFISTITLKTKVAIAAIMTLIKIMEECFEYTSSQFQTVVTVGSPTTHTSVITV